MGFVFDIIVLTVLAISTIVGYRRGFINSLIGVIGIVVSIILSLTVAPPLADAVYSAAFESRVLDVAEASIENSHKKGELGKEETINELFDKMPSFVTKYAKNTEVLSYTDLLGIESRQVAEEICDAVIDPAIISILKYLLVIILFFPFLLLSRIVSRFISALIKGNILGNLNSVLGGVVGLVRGVVIVLIFTLTASLISNLLPGEVFKSAVNSSFSVSLILGMIPFSF